MKVRAKSVSELYSMKIPCLEFEGKWYDAFDKPEKSGVIFIYGRSGNGKTSLTIQLCKYLTRFGKVEYNSLEEGHSKTIIDALKRENMHDIPKGKFLLLNAMPISELDKRLKKKQSADFIVIDSFQYTQLSFADYRAFVERHPKKLFIIVSQVEGNQPKGRTAVSVMYDASLKIWVEGYRAISKGRFIGTVGHMDVWKEKAEEIWGK